MLDETRLTRGSALKLSAMTAIGTAMSAERMGNSTAYRPIQITT